MTDTEDTTLVTQHEHDVMMTQLDDVDMTSRCINLDMGLASLDNLTEHLMRFVGGNEYDPCSDALLPHPLPTSNLHSLDLASSETPSPPSTSAQSTLSRTGSCISTKDFEQLNRSISYVRNLLLNFQDNNNRVVDRGFGERSAPLRGMDCEGGMDANVPIESADVTKESSSFDSCMPEFLEMQDASDTVRTSTRERNASLEVIRLKQDLTRCKETLRAMKSDRKRMRSEKQDLVSQMRQLYHTLEDKESELRDFIRSHEQRVNEVTDQLRLVATEKDELLKENGDLKRTADESQRQYLALVDELNRKNDLVTKLEQQIFKLFPRLEGKNNFRGMICGNGGISSDDFPSKPLNKGGHYSSNEELPPYQRVFLVDPARDSDPIPRTSSVSEIQLQDSRQKALQRVEFARNHSGHLFRGNSPGRQNSKDKNSTTKNEILRKSNSFIRSSRALSESSSRRFSVLTPQNYHDKVQTVSEAMSLPISQWKADHVLAWMELDMEMTAYGEACAENIKSGKVLLSLTDSELDSALQLSSPLHKRKLRLAIEELRDSAAVQYPCAARIDSLWVAQNWIPSLGLPQYSSAFEAQLVDGRLLNSLFRKELDKYLGVRKKFHQSSIEHGIEVLRLLEFNKQALTDRRSQCSDNFTDAIVWTNQKVIQWTEHIDLHEYTRNLKDSGIHGGVLVLDRSFNSDSLAAILNIPSSKSYVRRHLAAELDNIVQPARAQLESAINSKKSVGTSVTRSVSSPGVKNVREVTPTTTGGLRRAGTEVARRSGSEKRSSFKGSFAKAFGRKAPKEV